MINSIAVADDSKLARTIVIRCLEIVGFAEASFFQGNNGKEVLDIVKEEKIDLIISDLNMPEVDGFKLLEQIKASPQHNHIPVIIITSASNEAQIEELVKMGAETVVKKPINPTVLSEVMDKYN